MRYRRWLRLRARTKEEVTREIDDELEAHVAMRAEELLGAGETLPRARAEALRRFGDYETARAELIRSAQLRRGRERRLEWQSGIGRDLLYGVRRAHKHPHATIGAALLLALGIGLASAVFTLVNGVLIRSLPFPDSARLYAVATLDSAGNEVPTLAMANWLDWRAQSRTVAAGALWRSFRTPVAIEGEALRATVTSVTGDFFRVLQAPMLVGRAFTHEEAQNGEAGVVVSEAFWRGTLGSRRLPLTVTLGSQQREVVGVVQSGYGYPRDSEVWSALIERPAGGMQRNFINYSGVVRLAASATQAQADEELDAISNRIRQSDPAALYLWGVTLTPLKSSIVGEAASYLPVLLVAVFLVLLIACANLAGLNSARASTRRTEMAVRRSLGAGSGRLVRQLLVEHVVVALLGGALGVVLAHALVQLTLASSATLLPRLDEIRIDLRVLTFASAITFLSGLLTGVAPALRLARVSLREQTSGPKGGITGGRGLPGSVLVGLELAAAIVLLIGSMLLARSYRALLARDLGYDTKDIIAADVVLPRHRYPESTQVLQYWERLLQQLRLTPGVVAAGAATWIPMGGGATTFVDAEDNPAANSGGGYRIVGDDYFRVLGIRLLAGRAIEPRDAAGAPRVAVINRSMARMLWPGMDPLGRRLRTPVMEGGPSGDPPAPWLTVIGVVEDVRHWGIQQEAVPELYVAYAQVPQFATSMAAVIRVRGAPAAMIPALREAIRVVDPHTPADMQTMQDRLDASLQSRKLILSVLGMFGSASLLLAAIGLYTVLAFAVSQRTREIAIRLVLGADGSALIRMVFTNAMAIVAWGVVAGLAAAAGLTRFISGMLVDVKPLDPLSLLIVPVLLLLTGALAALLPARRAARLSPSAALQAE